jgi:branched-chain amino acid transport system substrate-binding protein
MSGLFNTAHWSPDFSNAAEPEVRRRVQEGVRPHADALRLAGLRHGALIDAAVRDVKGKIEDHEAVRKALKAAKFESVRGPFRFNTNQYPIQNYYVRTVGSDGKGGLINKSFSEPILKDHGDAYVQACAMK